MIGKSSSFLLSTKKNEANHFTSLEKQLKH